MERGKDLPANEGIESPVKLDYAKKTPQSIPWQVSSLMWLAAACLCGWFLWLCIRLSSTQSDSWGRVWAGVAFIVGIAAIGIICLIKAIRPLFR